MTPVKAAFLDKVIELEPLIAVSEVPLFMEVLPAQEMPLVEMPPEQGEQAISKSTMLPILPMLYIQQPMEQAMHLMLPARWQYPVS